MVSFVVLPKASAVGGAVPRLPEWVKPGTTLDKDVVLGEGSWLRKGTVLDTDLTLEAGTLIAAGSTLPMDVTLKAGTMMEAGYVLDTNYTLDAGTVMQAGSVLEADLTIDAGTQMKDRYLEADRTIKSGTTLNAGYVLEADRVIKQGTQLKAGYVLEVDVKQEDGSILPAGTELTDDLTLTEDVVIAAGMELKNDWTLSEDLVLKKGTLVQNDWALEEDLTLKRGTTLYNAWELQDAVPLEKGTVLNNSWERKEDVVLKAETVTNNAQVLPEELTLSAGDKVKANYQLVQKVVIPEGTELQNGMYLDNATDAVVKPLGIPGNGKIDLWNIDTTQSLQSGDSEVNDDDKGTLYFVWDAQTNRFSYITTKADLEKAQKEAQNKGIRNVLQVRYKSNYGTGNTYYWAKAADKDNTDGNDKTIKDQYGLSGLGIKLGGHSEGKAEFQALTYGQSQAAISDASKKLEKGQIIAGQKTGQIYGSNSNKSDDGKKSVEGTTSGAHGGAGLFLKVGATMTGDVAGSFINNCLDPSGTENVHGGAVYVSNDAKIDGNITGDFIGNYIRTQGKPFGGAIYNMGDIDGEITGTFIGNFTESRQPNYNKNPGEGKPNISDGSTAVGGAISNGTETFVSSISASESPNNKAMNSKDEVDAWYNAQVHIKKISGYFIGNYALAVSWNSEENCGDTIGGAIVNYGRIDEIEGVFVGNYASSARTANSGAIRNYQRQYLASIGKDDGNMNKVVLSGIFFNNYAQGGVGDATGGVMRNNGNINGKIQGLFVGNFTSTTGKQLEQDEASMGTYNYIRDNNGTVTRERLGMSYGGAIYNDVKVDMGLANRPNIGDIEGTFIDNYASSVWGEAAGGAIVNRDSKIATINSSFVGNHAVSEHFMARGGAIYNDESGYFTDKGWTGEIQNLGDEFAYTKDNTITSIFQENYAQGKTAQGGAVFVSHNSKIDNIYVYFKGNYAESAFDAEADTEYYTELRESTNKVENKSGYTPTFKPKEIIADGMLRPTAQGGALYVADGASTLNINGAFEENYAKTNGVGTLTYVEVPEDGTDGGAAEPAMKKEYTHNGTGISANGEEIAQGGAIYVSKKGGVENIQNITADFSGNYAETAGKNTVAEAKAKAQGGAIYVSDEGAVKNIYGDFLKNRAKSSGSGNVEALAQGGAIYVNKLGEVSDLESHFIGNIAESTGSDNGDVSVQGGAIYASEESSIGRINGSFEGNIAQAKNLGGDIADVLKVQGGAMFVDEKAHTGSVHANFVNNQATSQADVATEEYVGGGALYVADAGYIGNVGHKAENANDTSIYVTVSGNEVIASGSSDTLQEQRARGGAFFVSQRNADLDQSIGNITADFTKNKVEAHAGNFTAPRERYALGGAIYLSKEGKIGNITGGTEGFAKNTVTVTDGNSEGEVDLHAWGGAMYLSEDAEVGHIIANFTNNAIDTSRADGNATESVAGGAIYLAGGAEVQDIGLKTKDAKNNDVYQLVKIDSNTLTAGGEGENLRTQDVKGGAIYVGMDLQDDKTAVGNLGNIYASSISRNEIKVGLGASKVVDKRAAQGGAIYVADGSTVKDIIAHGKGFDRNSITVTGGSNENVRSAAALGDMESDLMVQGGAIYVAEKGHTGALQAGFTNNTLTSAAAGNFKEYVGGGAIYVASAGYVEEIGYAGEDAKGNYVVAEISGNKVNANGLSAKLVEQRARGGAILLSSAGGEGYSTKSIKADFVGNSITAKADEGAKGLEKRYALGGAIYLSNGGVIDGDIISGSKGFAGNTITVSGGNDDEGKVDLSAWGGAFYVSEDATVQDVMASFTGNTIDTEGAMGNATESVAGGALYVAGGANVGNIGMTEDGVNKEYRLVDVNNNTLIAGGNGKNLTQQDVKGGAIYVGANLIQGGKQSVGNLGAIYARSVSGNTITATLGTSKVMNDRAAQGGAIYVANGSSVGDIIAYPRGFDGNSITVSGGSNENLREDNKTATDFADETKSDLVVQGGAIYVADGGHTGVLYANFINSELISNAAGNFKEYVGGGAIYVADGGYVEEIGYDGTNDRGEYVVAEISRNKLTAYGESTKLVEQRVRGGAILLSGVGGEGYSTKDITADFVGNEIKAYAVEGATDLKTRYALGGAIYLSKGGVIQGSITSGSDGFAKNSIIVRGGNKANETELYARGGAMYVAERAKVGAVLADFTDNTISTDSATGNKTEHLGGGAVFVDNKAIMGDIGSEALHVHIERNKLTGGGAGEKLTEQSVRGGAIHVNDSGRIGSIYADEVKDNSITVNFGTSAEMQKRYAQGGAIYLAANAKVGDIISADGQDGFRGNSITVTGGVDKVQPLSKPLDQPQNEDDDTDKQALYAQGGALYVGSSAVLNSVVANFTENTIDTTKASGAEVERVAGGAIYVSGGAQIAERIGTKDQIVKITHNSITAGGNGAQLTQQWGRGGAIFVGVDAAGSDVGSIGDIYADITDNSITLNAPEKASLQLTKRVARGGAIFLADGGTINTITQSDRGDGIGFTRNTITVTGGNAAGAVELSAQGGAMYVARSGGAKGIFSGFELNGIDTTNSNGNLTETVSGGAIFLDQGGCIEAIGEATKPVVIRDNYLHAGGKGMKLQSQTVQGGAMYVAGEGTAESGAVGNIFADVEDNEIIAGADESPYLVKRRIQGGAIYLADEGEIDDIEMGSTGFRGNHIVVNKGGKSGTVELVAQGGAIYVADDGSIGDIHANFENNSIISNGEGNVYSWAQGGAIYVSGGGSIGHLGRETEWVNISGNYVTVGKKAVAGGEPGEGKEAQKYAMGGAIYVASEGGKSGTIKDIYAHFTGNYAFADKGESPYVEARVQGGAVFVADSASVGAIKGDFTGNHVESAEQSGEGSKELVHGGAIDVARSGTAESLEGSFYRNYAVNSHRAPQDTVSGSDMHAKGGAIYVSDLGSITKIGSAGSMFEENYVEGSGQVRAGALFVSKANVTEIEGTFLRNRATGDDPTLTYGGAMRFDNSSIKQLKSDFIQNESNGYGGALSLTSGGYIYIVSGDFLGNKASINGAGVENMGNIGLRGHIVLDKEKGGDKPNDDYSNALVRYDENGVKYLETERDSTDTKHLDAGDVGYTNKQGRGEYDGSFFGGFVNSNFLYNTIVADKNLANDSHELFRGAGIYTDKDLFITVNDGQEVIMSGNKIENPDGTKTRSAIYVDNKNYTHSEGDYESIVVYLVAQEHGVLRIDDNIRGHEDSEHGVVLRLRGYSDKEYTDNYHDGTGLIVLNNRVEKTYTVMDDVTLYIGYKPITFMDERYFELYSTDRNGKSVTSYKDVQVGDEGEQNIIMSELGASTYLDVAGTATRRGKSISRADKGEHHQSDIFRDSHISVRSGTVALTETTYATKTGANGRNQDRFSDMDPTEAYTEYLFGSLIAYGADYNYGEYGTEDAKVKAEYGSSKLSAHTEPTTGHTYRGGSGDALYATFEFGMNYDETQVYDLALRNKYYYADMNGNPTENSSWVDKAGEVHNYADYLVDGKKVNVVRTMAKSDVLTVFAVWDDAAGAPDWKQTSKGRVTLNGITVQAAMDGWKYTAKSVGGAQTDANLLSKESKEGVIDTADHYNHDLYVQLINYMLVDEKRTPITDDMEKLNTFYALFDEEKKDAAADTNSGYHLLRLSDHFDLVHQATAYMKGSDVLADEIELATTVTKDDSVHIVNWRDHLAEWAEHEGSWDEKATQKDGSVKETAGLYDGKKHFLLDQTVYYLNRNINLLPNPTNGDDYTGKQMWGKDLTVEGAAKWRTLDLQRMNMLSLIIPDQAVRLQTFRLTHVLEDHIQNLGDLTFDTMTMDKALVVNNAGNARGESHTLDNRLTITGVMDIDFTITTEGNLLDRYTNTMADGAKVNYHETEQHGDMVIDHSTKATNASAASVAPKADGAEGDADTLSASIIRITGVVEHQDITHRGDDKMELQSKKVTYTDAEEAQKLPTWSIKTGSITDSVRETVTTNTYLDTTGEDKKTATAQFRAFVDNKLVMQGGAFNLGTMYKNRLQLREFNVQGGGVFVDSSTIDMNKEIMGGIDARNGDADYAGNGNAKNTTAVGAGLIWLDEFKLEGSSEKEILHVKFVDDGVGKAVRDGMGIANGVEASGLRIMPDGEGKYEWEVTYNDARAHNDKEDIYRGKTGVKGMYTFTRRGFTQEAQIAPVTQMTGSFMTMMQVYNHAFQHADMYADSVYDAQRERLAERSYTVVNPTKDKNATVPEAIARRCVDKNSMKKGLWFNTFSSTEKMPLHNGPEVRMDMYGGFIGGDTTLHEQRNGWASVWSFFGGYVGSTQRYEGIRIRQNGANVGGTATFYKKNFYTALTASVGTAEARATGRGGSEDFDMYMGGIASRSGMSFTLGNGSYVLQPGLLLSLSVFDTGDYTNAYGSRISAKPTTAFQVNPSVKLIRKTSCVWKPYASVGAVFNFFGGGESKINGTDLPSMSINPYVEYSLGVQRTLGDHFTIFGQATGRNGGRNGAELNLGLRYAW